MNAGFSALLSVGDRVKIIKPNEINNRSRYLWIPAMDRFHGVETHVIKVLDRLKALDRPEDEVMPAYDLDIDNGEFGWLHSYLQPIKYDT